MKAGDTHNKTAHICKKCKYCDGDYIYKGTNGFSARIEIVVDIETKSGKTVYLKTGWILLPKGEIKLSTPFSGFKD